MFTGNLNSQIYLEILENSTDEVNTLHPNGFILLWDNDLKQRSELS